VSFLIAAAGLKTPTRNGYNAQGVNLNFRFALCVLCAYPISHVKLLSRYVSLLASLINQCLYYTLYKKGGAQTQVHTKFKFSASRSYMSAD